MVEPGMINLDDAQNLITNKDDMHECLVRNGYLPPPLKNSVCTMKWMCGVYSDKYWCLVKKDSAPTQMCAVKLTKAQLADILADEMTAMSPGFQEPI